MRDLFDPSPEEQIIVLIERLGIRKAERLIEGCEGCNPDAEIPFDWIFDRITGSDASATDDYILENPAKCPNCRHDVLEKTLIEPE